MALDLTAELHQGFDSFPSGKRPTGLASVKGIAWELGRHFALKGLPRPKRAARSYGLYVRVDGQVFAQIGGGQWLIVDGLTKRLKAKGQS